MSRRAANFAFICLSGALRSLLPLPGILKTLLIPVLASHMLAACAVEGDFGRIQPTWVSKTADEFLLNANIMTRGLNRPELDRYEIVLRETGSVLSQPLEFAPQLQDMPLRHPLPPNEGRYEREPTAVPPVAIGGALDRDHQMLTRFGEAARRVIDTYSQQMESILRYDPNLRYQKIEEARARLQENFGYIDSVFSAFGHKLQAYHYAIGELRYRDDTAYSGELEASLAHLRDRTAALEYEIRHHFGAVLARSERHTAFAMARSRGRFGLREPYGQQQDIRQGAEVDPYGPASPPLK